MTGHPIRNAEIRIFKSIDDGEHIGRLRPYNSYPITFHGPSESEVRAKMEAFIEEAIEKHEAQIISRKEAAEKARISRLRKEAK